MTTVRPPGGDGSQLDALATVEERVMSLLGHKVVVIGASSGTGAAICAQVVALGASVVMVSLSKDRLDTAAAAIDGEVSRGSITLTSSTAITNPPRAGGAAVMNAASGAVAVLGRSLAAELAPVRVNVIAPGIVNSGVWDDSSVRDSSSTDAPCRSVISGSPPSSPSPTFS